MQLGTNAGTARLQVGQRDLRQQRTRSFDERLERQPVRLVVVTCLLKATPSGPAARFPRLSE